MRPSGLRVCLDSAIEFQSKRGCCVQKYFSWCCIPISDFCLNDVLNVTQHKNMGLSWIMWQSYKFILWPPVLIISTLFLRNQVCLSLTWQLLKILQYLQRFLSTVTCRLRMVAKSCFTNNSHLQIADTFVCSTGLNVWFLFWLVKCVVMNSGKNHLMLQIVAFMLQMWWNGSHRHKSEGKWIENAFVINWFRLEFVKSVFVISSICDRS